MTAATDKDFVMPAKKPRVRKDPTPKVSAQRPTKPRSPPRTTALKRQAAQDKPTRSTTTQVASANRADSKAKCPDIPDFSQDTETTLPVVQTFGRECISEPPKSVDQGIAETSEPTTAQIEDKTRGEPTPPPGPFIASEDGIESSIASDTPVETESPSESKQARVLALLRSPQGAMIAAMTSVTYWQAHSVRGFLTSVVRQKLGLNLTSEKVDGERRYHITHDADPGGAPSIDQSSPSASRSAADVPLVSPAKVAE